MTFGSEAAGGRGDASGGLGGESMDRETCVGVCGRCSDVSGNIDDGELTR